MLGVIQVSFENFEIHRFLKSCPAAFSDWVAAASLNVHRRAIPAQNRYFSLTVTAM